MRYEHSVTGVVVSVRDDKVLGPEWVPADGSGKRPRRSAKPAPAAEAESKAESEPADDTFVVSDHNVADVLAFVADDAERAAEVLAAETAGKNRSSLVEKLEALVGDGD